MAFNLDAAIRIAAKVQGLSDFKTLADRLLNVNEASQNSRSSLQQLTAEYDRLANGSIRTVASTKAQSAALQELGTKTRANASEMRLGATAAQAFGSILQRLRGQSVGVVDGVEQSASKAAGSIRELGGALVPTDQQLAKVRNEILALGTSSKQTEQSINQQIDVLKNLRSQAEINGRLYQQLTADLDRLKTATQSLDAAGSKGAQGIQKVTTASKASSVAIDGQIKMLARLQRTLTQGGEGYAAIGRQIDALKAKAASLDLSKVGMPGPGGVAAGAVGAIRQIVDLRRELAQTSPGRVVLAGEGAAAAGLAGVTGAGVAAGLGGLGGGLSGVAGQLDVIASKAAALPGILKPLGGLLSSPAAAAGNAIANWGAGLTAAQSKLAALSAPFQGIATAIQTIGPETAAAAGVASLAIASVYDVLKRRADEAQRDLEQSFRGITDEVQQTLRQMTQLFDRAPSARLAAQQDLRQRNLTRLGEVAPGSIDARRAANAVVAAEREIAKIQGQQNELLNQARERENVGVRLQQEQRKVALDRLNVQRQLTQESRNEREQLQQTKAISGSIRRNQERVARDQKRLRRDAAAAFPRSTMLALPAAGQTTFQGAVDVRGFGGGARGRVRRPEIPSQIMLDRPGRVSIRGSTDVLGLSTNAVTDAVKKRRGALRDLFVEISKSEQASNGSINSLQRQRSAWQALQNAVNPAAPAYERSRKKIAELDSQLKALTATQERSTKAQERATKAQERGIGREAVGSALGALAMGGGIQGAAGALAGGLAFSGSVAGLAAGAGISAAVGAGTLAARVGVDAETAQVRLKALTDQFGEYNQAQAAAARIAQTLRISQTEASDSFSKLYGALRPIGVTLQEIEDAFIGFSAAARASGATSVETSAALLQLKQALGSGVLQGDELRSVREQAPAAAQAIAREMGVTIGELKKLGSEGKITTDIVLRALARLKNENLDKLNAQFNTSAQALQDLRVATDNFGVALSNSFGPAAVATVRALTGAMNGLGDAISSLNNPEGTARNAIRAGRLPDMAQAAEIFKGSSGVGGVGLSGIIAEARDLARIRNQSFNKVVAELMRNRLERIENQPTSLTSAQLAEQRRAASEREAGRRRAAAGDQEKQSKAEAKQAKEREKEAKAEANAASRINDLLQDNLRLNTELGNIGKDRISQIYAELNLIPQLLRLDLPRLNASLKGKELSQARINTLLAASQRDAELREELNNVNKEIDDITRGAIDLRVSVLSGLVPKESPLQQEIQRVEKELIDAEKEAVARQDRLNKLGGTHPATAKARDTLGALRGDLAAADPNAIASQRLVQPDIDALRQQITELQNAGRELSTLEQLTTKYGADWEKINPAIRATLTTLAQQRDKLQQNVDKTQEWIDTLNQAGTTIGGVLNDLITGTDDWRSSLTSALRSLAKLAFQAALMGLAGDDGIGILSFLTGTLKAKKQAKGGVWENGIQAFASGGVVNRPTVLPLAGEAGPEAIMPLRRLPSGRLGVEAAGGGNSGGTYNVVVNVDATGSEVQGDQQQAAALGRVISAAVQTELVRQKRPGGLLAGGR